VDDVGAGYSGLSQIAAVHPSYLKLDRSLVEGIDADDGRAALVGAFVGYAERADVMLVAEGVECESELRTLIELGVPLGQGFYLARPAPPWQTVTAGVLPAADARDTRSARDQRVGRQAKAGRLQRV
jgi:EAL domain-containing protein (putative c-di-GMP-specific phosphodiesterase class I)